MPPGSATASQDYAASASQPQGSSASYENASHESLLASLEQITALNAPICFYDNKDTPKETYYLQQLHPTGTLVLVVIFMGKKPLKDKATSEFLATLCYGLRGLRVYDTAQAPAKITWK